MTWVLSEPFSNVFVTAEEEGLRIHSDTIDITAPEIIFPEPLSPLGRHIPSLVPQLLELGLASTEGSSILIPYKDLVCLPEYGIYALEELAPWAPFYCEISSHGSLGIPDFNYHIKFYNGRNRIHLERIGSFVKTGDAIYCLDKQTYSLVNAVDTFRSLSPEEKTATQGMISFATIRELAEGVGAQIDNFILGNRVLIPPALGIDLIDEGDGRISFAPFVEGVPQEELRRVFSSSEDMSSLHLDDGRGGRIRLIFNADQEEALRRMSRVRHLGGRDKADVLRNPEAVFDGVAGAVDLELGDFGPRVKGIGSFPAIAQPVIRNCGTGIFEDSPLNGEARETHKFDAGIQCRYSDGSEETVNFANANEVVRFYNEVRASYEQGRGTVDLEGRSIVVDRDFVAGVEALANRVTKKVPLRCHAGDDDRKYLLIYENEEELDYVEKEKLAGIDPELFFIPESVRDDKRPKPHQLEGLRWMQHNYLLGRGGCLLADDMGLGKTFQVLMFIAWLIERGDIAPKDSANPEAAPWNPILIVSPTILLENENWLQDIRKFFKNNGAVFQPWHILYKRGINEMRIAGASGQETKVSKALLDPDKLRLNRIILTNYETLVNYQFSFANLKSAWTVVVTDEAQAHKTPKTKRSFALKSMSPKFKIPCTGTPVETRLLDVWNIIDYIQPGELLGSAQDFTKNYEQPIADNPERAEEILNSLRERLQFGSESAYILRREKSQVLEGLPEKQIHKVECDLSAEQRERHLEYIDSVYKSDQRGIYLSVIHSLMELYQHPAIYPTYDPYGPGRLAEMTASCPKLEKLIGILTNVKQAGEKALIFTRSLDMQQLIVAAIREAFGQRIDIVNGAAKQGGETATSSATRKSMIKRFQTEDSVNFIVLSPDVAGVGLNLVEANHVIHYGRWWNPAKELQATDRAYRIGQERDVHVYYLIAKDPQCEFRTFDEKLDALIDRRMKMARDFLLPLPEEGELAGAVYREIFGESAPSSEPVRSLTIEGLRMLTWDRFESLISLLEEGTGRRSVVTPRAGDMGIDVVSVQGNVVRLIQCKHTRTEADLEPEVINETIYGFDNYRAHFFRCSNYTLNPVLATNAKVSRSLALKCKQRGIELIDCQTLVDLLSRQSITIANIEIAEGMRLENLGDLSGWLVKVA
jgi:hypothetical protein